MKSEKFVSVLAGIVCGCVVAGSGFAMYSIRENSGSRFWYHAVAASPDDSKDFVFLGYSLEAEGNFTEAEKAFERAHALRIRSLSPIMELGNLAERRGDRAQARLYWQQIADTTRGATTNQGRTWHAKANAKLARVSQ